MTATKVLLVLVGATTLLVNAPERFWVQNRSASWAGQAALKPGEIFRDRLQNGREGPEMVAVSTGSFEMGDILDSGKPVHTVHMRKPFGVSRYEVMFDQYDEFARMTGRASPGDEGWGRGKRPVINVSWNDAAEYTKWLSVQTGKRYRLPTEAEWEYVARSGGRDEKWSGTSREQELGDFAWYEANSSDRTQPVGTKKPNRIGLYDMSGNVWEWVEDCWHENYKGAPTDGIAWLVEAGGSCDQRVLRGGSWNAASVRLRSSLRNRRSTDNRTNYIGFRLVRDID
jgi:formylglycine-generating enzyme required for sulfatase activity